MTTPPTPRSGMRRPGFTLAEMLVAMVLLAIIGGVVMRVVTRQQRFYRGVSDVMDQRSQMRQAMSILANDLRQMSSAGGDILALSDSAIDFQATIGHGIACNIQGGRTQVDLPPKALASGQRLTSFTLDPRAGDLLFAYDDSTTTGGIDDAWQTDTVTDVSTVTTTCLGAPYTDPTLDAGKSRYRITLSGALSPYVATGNPVRIARRMRYKLYQAQDGKWYLGWSDWNGTSWNTMEAIAGPYRSYASGSGAPNGLSFQFFDSTGVQITSLARRLDVARIDLVVRALTAAPINVGGMKQGQYADSLRTKIAIRNRS
jgi:prepilin-type N-terminal cleavage/methylation domain-containing protein